MDTELSSENTKLITAAPFHLRLSELQLPVFQIKYMCLNIILK